jgi:hypothetical protein
MISNWTVSVLYPKMPKGHLECIYLLAWRSRNASSCSVVDSTNGSLLKMEAVGTIYQITLRQNPLDGNIDAS